MIPNGTERLSEITIDLINQYLKLTTVKNDRTVEHIVSNGKSIFSLDGRKEFTEEEVKTLVLPLHELNSCKTTIPIYTVYRNLTTGTIISSVVNRKNFFKEYLVLKSNTREHRDRFLVFYFEPKTYALKYTSFTMTKLK
jgi:hypothetical protein